MKDQKKSVTMSIHFSSPRSPCTDWWVSVLERRWPGHARLTAAREPNSTRLMTARRWTEALRPLDLRMTTHARCTGVWANGNDGGVSVFGLFPGARV